MRIPATTLLAAALLLGSACDTKPTEAKSDAAKADAAVEDAPAPEQPAAPAEPEQPAAPEDGVTPVTDGAKGLEFELVAGDPPVVVEVGPEGEYDDWMAKFSTKPEATKLDDLCSEGGAEDGVFTTVTAIASTGYSKVLASKVIVFEGSHTFDDSGTEESGPAVLFWRADEPVCWTEHNTNGDERIATGLFSN